MASVCRRCSGEGRVNRRVLAVGPIRPFRNGLFVSGDTAQNFVRPGEGVEAQIAYGCPYCKGKGTVG